jgi:hypothetical protein
VRLYSDEWIAAFNEAVAELEPDPDVSFRLHQIVDDGPEGTVRVTLVAHEGRVTLAREPAREPARDGAREPARDGAREPARDGAGDAPVPDATISVQFDDAVALARGELDPSGLLAAGRVRVRGNLSVLVRGQSLLAAAASRLGPLSEQTTP